ncbi:MAG: exodeoxyribonuclease VII large subunit, partial [Candidatus Neomarinimicrobiota bacterium]
VLTSDTGAAIRDILQILERRAPYVEVLLRPTLVQGSRAAADLVAGIDYMESRVRPDCLIVGRGGGSIEDLWCFNEESVVRAIAACSLPVISAVGHETDVTLADLAADVRAPTPSAAAELVAPSREDLLRRLEQSTHKLQQGMQRRLERCWQGLDLWEQRLQAQQPLRQLERQEERLRQWEDRMRLAVRQSLGQARDRWTHYASALELLNPHNILERGYALALAETEDRLLESVRDIAPGDPFRLRLADGEFPARRDPQRQ